MLALSGLHSLELHLFPAPLMKKFVLLALVTTVALAVARTSQAAGVIGTSVTGSLNFNGGSTNYFDPSNGFVPAGYLNQSGTTVSIASPAVEFGFDDGFNTDTANFSAFQFTIEDSVAGDGGAGAFTMTFVDAAFSGLTLNQATDFFPGGLSYSLVGSTITINWAGGPVLGGDDYTSTFTLAAVPEPSTWALLGFGAVGAGVVALRRRQTA